MSTNKFSFTLNNYSQAEVASLAQYAASPDCKYVVYGHEMSSTGTPHLQGYTILSKRASVTTVVNRFPLHIWMARAHFEPAGGSEKQNRDYCLKLRPGDTPNEIFFEKDNRQQGQRSDIQLAVAELKSNGIDGVVALYPEVYLRYANNLERLFVRLNAKPRTCAPQVFWFYGPTGTGKSRAAAQLADAAGSQWWSGKDLRWFQSYVQQHTAIIDDFRGDFCKFHELLRLLDRYPFEVEFKGSSIHFNSPRVIFTSCHPPWEVYSNSQHENVRQLLRRIAKIVRFNATDDFPHNAEVVVLGEYSQANVVGKFTEIVPTEQPALEGTPGVSTPGDSQRSVSTEIHDVRSARSTPEVSTPAPTRRRVSQPVRVRTAPPARRQATSFGERRIGPNNRVSPTPVNPSPAPLQYGTIFTGTGDVWKYPIVSGPCSQSSSSLAAELDGDLFEGL